MIFSKERITLAIGLLMFVIGVMPSLYIANLDLQAAVEGMMEEFGGPPVLYKNGAIQDPITCPSILVAGETMQMRAKINIPEDLLSEYDIYMLGGSLSDTPSESVVIKKVTDWRESKSPGEGTHQFLWRVTISQPGIYWYGVFARNKNDVQKLYSGGSPYWQNSDWAECYLPVISSIGFTGKQILAINRLWFQVFWIAGFGICVWWFITYPSKNHRIERLILITILGVITFYGVIILCLKNLL